MKAFMIMVAIMSIVAQNTNAMDKVTCVTDKTEYYQGEEVFITITNNSDGDIEIPDRKYIDGRFAMPALEMKLKNGNIYKTMKMIMTVDRIDTIKLLIKESRVYILRLMTIDESRKEMVSIPGVYARPGTYKVIFHDTYKLFPFEIMSNEFTIRSNLNISK
jgi:hypothetical protein